MSNLCEKSPYCGALCWKMDMLTETVYCKQKAAVLVFNMKERVEKDEYF